MDKTNVVERVEDLSKTLTNNLFPDTERGTGLGLIIPNAANIPSGFYERQVSKIFDKLNLKNQDKTIGKALDLLEGMVNTKTFENIAKQASAEVWEAAAENLAKSGNKSEALAKLTSETYKSLSAKITNNSQIIADAAADMSKLSKLASGLNLVGKHLGPAVTAIDLAMAIRSDDLNAVVKAATLTAVGMAAMAVTAGAPLVFAIGITTIATITIAYAWDVFKIGDWLGITGESFLERVEETLDILGNLWDELPDSNFKGFGYYLWDELTGSNTLEKYINDVNRTGKYQVYDPLTLDLDGDGIETTAIEGLNSTLFDHNKDGIRTATGWVSADDGLLVLDRNSDGVINHGGELFGDNTLLKDGSLAANGFAALAEFDENGDGKIDAQDAVFHQLKVWRDLNQDGISQEGELFTLSELGITGLNLAHLETNNRQGNGNTIARTGSYTDTEGKEHLMGDLLFDSNPMISRFTDKIALSAEQRRAPNLRGMGRLRDLQEAAAKSSDLAETLQNYSTANTKQEQLALLDQLVRAWADTDPNKTQFSTLAVAYIRSSSSGSRLTPGQASKLGVQMLSSEMLEASNELHQLKDKIAILDSFTGQNSSKLYFGTVAEARGIIDIVKNSYADLSHKVYEGLLFQTRLKPYLDELSFKFENSEFVLDYAAVETRFKQVFAENPQKAFIDLGELLAFANIKDWHQGMALLSDFAHQGKEDGQLQDWLAMLGEKTISMLSEQNGDDMSNILRAVGLLGRDVLNGNGGDDHLIIGSATAVVDGGSGSDLYEFYQGFGMTTVHNHDTSDNRFDVIRLHGVSKDAVSYTREGDDLIIRVAGEANSITVVKMFAGDILSHHIDAIEYEGGQITLAEIKETLLRGTDGNDVLLGYGDDDTVYAGAGDDRIRTFAGNDIIYAGAGNDDIDAGNGNDIIYLETGNNRAYGGDDDDVIHSGSGNDHLEGGIGSDTYVFAKQFAQDVVLNFNPQQQDTDVLKFTHAKLNDVRIYRHESDLLIAQNDGQKVTVQNFFDQDGKGDYTVQELQFADGKSLNTEQLRQWVINPTRGDDTIYAYAEGGKLYGGNGNDTLIGNQGSDYLAGGNGNDTLMGGKGDDRLEGGIGNDTYLFNLGDGNDRIYDSFGNDVLKLGKDIAKQDLWFTRVGRDLSIQILGENDTITVEGWFNIIPRQIESIQTHDGAQIHVSAVNQLVQAMAAFAPNQENSLSTPEQMREYSKQILAGHQFWQLQDTTAAFVI